MTRKRFQKLARALITHYQNLGLKADYRKIKDWEIYPSEHITYNEYLRSFEANLLFELLFDDDWSARP